MASTVVQLYLERERVAFDQGDALEDGGIPVFRSADRAVRVLCRYINGKLRAASMRPGNGK